MSVWCVPSNNHKQKDSGACVCGVCKATITNYTFYHPCVRGVNMDVGYITKNITSN